MLQAVVPEADPDCDPGYTRASAGGGYGKVPYGGLGFVHVALAAVLVLTVVVLALMGGWLGMLFFVARQPGGSAVQEAGDAGGAAATPPRPGQ